MTAIQTTAGEQDLFATLNGIPQVDLLANLQAALGSGRHVWSILREVVTLRRGLGKLTPQEYFYYRLWDPNVPMAEKRRFVGKQAQNAMHVTANDQLWFATAADKILFHTLMSGARLPLPDLLAVTQPQRFAPDTPVLTTPAAVAGLLRRGDLYPLFAKPVGGKYSLSVVSGDAYDPDTDEVVLLGGERRAVDALAESMIEGTGYLIQRRLNPAQRLAATFGARLWSIRLLMLITPTGPLIHRAVAKIATGTNPADNYWRKGNMLGAIELNSGTITRIVQGTGANLAVNTLHPDTGKPIIGTPIPEWEELIRLVRQAATVFAGIRTQSWDIAVTDRGPVFLEVNFGGDLNLAQLAYGAGALDETYAEHLRRCGYRCGPA